MRQTVHLSVKDNLVHLLSEYNQSLYYIINSKAFFCRKVDEVNSATLLNMVDAQRGDNYNIEEHKHYV